VIKFVSDLRQAGGTLGSYTNNTDDITEIVLKVALYTINQANKLVCKLIKYYLIHTALLSGFEITTSVVIGTACIGSLQYDHGRDGP
jgi:hypothetical protein